MTSASGFDREDAKRFYDEFGARQDQQGFYEDAALDALIAHADFAAAHSVFELGCGTGRLAARLLADQLPSSARYVGTDISDTMVRLSSERLAPWAGRAAAHRSSGALDFASRGGPFDRFVSTYVFDLLDLEEITAVLAAARAAVGAGGLLCTAGLTHGTGPLSSTASRLWALIHHFRPALVGGCRPLDLGSLLPATQWRIQHREVVVSFAIPSEVIVAEAI